jgi:putative transposase
LAEESREKYGISRACRVLDIPRSNFYRKSIKDDTEVASALQKKAEEHPREGFWKAYHRLRREGHRWNHTWSMDFMQDRLENGHKIRLFNVIDDFNRQALCVEVESSFKSCNILWVLNHLIKRFGKPKRIRMDNGPEFIATTTQSWSEGHGIEFVYIQPGKPTQNSFIERFNGSLRRDVLDAMSFQTIQEVRAESQRWMDDYNHNRPHESLGNLPPIPYSQLQPNLTSLN